MALIERDVVVTTKHGRMPAFAACPDAPGAFPGVIFYMDAPGFREELCNMARRIAKHGYFCLLPDMYYRLGRWTGLAPSTSLKPRPVRSTGTALPSAPRFTPWPPSKRGHASSICGTGI